MNKLESFCVETEHESKEDIAKMLDLAVEAGATPYEGVKGSKSVYEETYNPHYFSFVGVDLSDRTYMDHYSTDTTFSSAAEACKYLDTVIKINKEKQEEPATMSNKLDSFYVATKNESAEDIAKMLDLAVKAGANPYSGVGKGRGPASSVTYAWLNHWPCNYNYVGINKERSTYFSDNVAHYDSQFYSIAEACDYLESFIDNQSNEEDDEVEDTKLDSFYVETANESVEDIAKMLDLAVKAGAIAHGGVSGSSVSYSCYNWPHSFFYAGINKDNKTFISDNTFSYNNRFTSVAEACDYLESVIDTLSEEDEVDLNMELNSFYVETKNETAGDMAEMLDLAVRAGAAAYAGVQGSVSSSIEYLYAHVPSSTEYIGVSKDIKTKMSDSKFHYGDTTFTSVADACVYLKSVIESQRLLKEPTKSDKLPLVKPAARTIKMTPAKVEVEVGISETPLLSPRVTELLLKYNADLFISSENGTLVYTLTVQQIEREFLVRTLEELETLFKAVEVLSSWQ